jgi:hypothetical protein
MSYESEGHLHSSENIAALVAGVGQALKPHLTAALGWEVTYADPTLTRNARMWQDSHGVLGLLVGVRTEGRDGRPKESFVLINEGASWGLNDEQRALLGDFSLRHGRNDALYEITSDRVLPMPQLPEKVGEGQMADASRAA